MTHLPRHGAPFPRYSQDPDVKTPEVSKGQGSELVYKIGNNCIRCGACEAECPEGAIYLGDTHFEVDPDKCVECGSCANVCPVAAVHPEEE
jgi:ferredoxin